MNNYIPLSVPVLRGNEKRYVNDCLDSGWISSVGSYVHRFEEEFANYTGSKYAVALVNGTAAIHLALLAAGIGEGDEVLVPDLTFIATINAIIYTGASPVFIDIDSKTNGICPRAVEQFIETNCSMENGALINRDTGRKISALLPVHIYGYSCDMDGLLSVAEKYNLVLIEDAAEAVGTFYNGRHAGTFGVAGCFSFNGNKILSTGGGGMLVTNDKTIADKVRHLSTQAKTDTLYYCHDTVGYNYRMSNIHAAIGTAQLEYIEETILHKSRIHDKYAEAFANIENMKLFAGEGNCRPNFWMGLLLVQPERREGFIRHMTAANIETRPLWKLNHEHSMFTEYTCSDLPNAIALYRRAVSIPCGHHMSESDIQRVIDEVKVFF